MGGRSALRTRLGAGGLRLLLVLVLASAAAANLLDIAWSGATSRGDLPLDLLTTICLAAAGAVALRSDAAARRATGDLARSEARQRSIVDGAGEAIIVINDQARIVTFNRAAETMFGYSAPEIVGQSLERLMTDGARAAHAAYLARTGVTAMVEAVKLRTVHKGVRKAGDSFPFELTMTEWLDGERRMFTGVMRDVTERERAAAALRESQARYAGLYENSPELLFTYAVDGMGGFVLESMNKAAEDYSGYTRSDLVGRSTDQLSGPEEARRLKRALLHCLHSGDSSEHEMRLHLKGEARVLQVALSPMHDAAGEITRILASARDDQGRLESSPARDRAA